MATDKFGNELHIGDYVCFAASNGNWRSSPVIVREKIKSISELGNGNALIELTDRALSISATRAVKCY